MLDINIGALLLILFGMLIFLRTFDTRVQRICGALMIIVGFLLSMGVLFINLS